MVLLVSKKIKSKKENIKKLKEEIELLKLQLKARESELEEVKKEVEELHRSISYRVGRWIAETKVGGWLKKVLRKYIWK